MQLKCAHIKDVMKRAVLTENEFLLSPGSTDRRR